MGKKSRFVGSYANLSVENGGCTEAYVETSWAVLVVLCNQLCVSLSSRSWSPFTRGDSLKQHKAQVIFYIAINSIIVMLISNLERAVQEMKP